MQWLNYQHLYYFFIVAREGSITGASSRLRLAQPTISAQLKSLEEMLGAPLFHREGKRLVLTSTGGIVLRYAEQIFSIGDQLLAHIEGEAIQSDRILKVGISQVVPKTTAYHMLEPVFDRKQGNIQLVCTEDSTEQLLAKLSIGEIDVIISDRPVPPLVKVKAFSFLVGKSGTTILAHRKLVAAHKNNLAQLVKANPIILPTTDCMIRIRIDAWLQKNRIIPSLVYSFQDRAIMKIVAREKHGLLPVPTIIEKEVRSQYNLSLVTHLPDVEEEFYIISTERRIKDPLITRICEWGQQRVFRGARPP